MRQGKIVLQIDDYIAYATFEVPENFGEIKLEDFAMRSLIPAWSAILSHIKYLQEDSNKGRAL